MTGQTPAEVVAPAAAAIATTPADNVTPAATGVVIEPSKGSGSEVTPPATNTDWLAGLTPENQELVKKKNWKDVNAGLSSYSELEKLSSSRQTPAEKQTYTADAYTFTIPENAKDINYSDDFAGGFKAMCAETGISPEIAGKVHDWYTKFATDTHGASTTEYATQVAGQVTKAQADLVAAWGVENTPAFKRNAELAQRAINQLGLMDDMVASGAIVETQTGKTVANANIMKAFAKVGLSMFAEDTIFGPVADGLNPFDPKTSDITAQGALIVNDPEKALLLIGSLPEADKARWAAQLPSIKARAAKKK